MAHTSNRTTFEYLPLTDASNEIRLLKLSDTPDTLDAIHCSLSVWNLETKPKYIAISYTWGPPPETCSIVINGQAFSVRASCLYLLQQVKNLGITEHIWIDAVCINQGDDAEKSAQVAMMSTIYKDATKLLICLGPHDRDSRFLFDTLVQHQRYADETLQSWSQDLTLDLDDLSVLWRGKAPSDRGHATFEMMSMAGRRKKFDEMSIWKFFEDWSAENYWSSGKVSKVARAFSALTRRTYFARLWIVQEVLLSRQAMVLCGDCYADFGALAGLEHSLSRFYQHNEGEFLFRGDFECSQAWIGLIHLAVDCGRNGRSGLPFITLVERTCDMGCYDLRDRIFGLLGLVDWQGQEPILPDYKTSQFDLALHVLRHVTRQDDAFISEPGPAQSPIITTFQIARALGLTAEYDDISRLLQERYSTRGLFDRSTSPCAAGKIILRPDFHCRISSVGADGSLQVRIGVEKPHLDERRDSQKFARLRFPHLEDIPGQAVKTGSELCARVTPHARPGDFLLSFRKQAFQDYGLVVRQSEDIFLIVGQAIVSRRARLCGEGQSTCDCRLGSEHRDGHEKPQKLDIEVLFDSLDLLLFVTQSMSSRDIASACESEFWENIDEGGRQHDYSTLGQPCEDPSRYEDRLRTSVTASHDGASSYARTAGRNSSTEGHEE